MKQNILLMAALTLASMGFARAEVPELKNGSWITVGDITKVSTTERDLAPALQFEYMVGKKTLGMLAYSLEGGLKDAKSLSFSIQGDHPHTAAVMLDEDGGGHWIALFAVPKTGWQKVTLGLADFTLGTGDNDPKDPNGKLDSGKIKSVALVDLDTFLGNDVNAATALFFPDLKPGPHSFYLKDVAFSEAAPAPTLLDGVGRPQAGWLAVGGVALKNVSGSPLGMPALEARYKSGGGRIGGMMRSLSLHALAGKSALTLTVASKLATTLRLQLEDDRGAKWDATLDVPGDNAKKTFRLRLADWEPSQDSKEPEAKFDLARIKQINLVDATGLASPETLENVLYLAGLDAK